MALVDNSGRTAKQFLWELFEHEYCAECQLDVKAHKAEIDVLGNWSVVCKTP